VLGSASDMHFYRELRLVRIPFILLMCSEQISTIIFSGVPTQPSDEFDYYGRLLILNLTFLICLFRNRPLAFTLDPFKHADSLIHRIKHSG
jgi:hypothetical protein